MSLLSACEEKKAFVSVSLDSFKELRDDAYELRMDDLSDAIRHIAFADTDRQASDRHTRNHYLEGGQFLWVSRNGVDGKADTLLRRIQTVDSLGYSPEKFGYSQLCSDIKRMRLLDFDDERNTITKVYARVEYYLTKACLRYAEGERFGYIDPFAVFNRLDVRDSDSVRVSYRQLYDVSTKRPDKTFLGNAIKAMSGDATELAKFLADSRPENPLYPLFTKQLAKATTQAERRLVLVNMERARWCNGDYPQRHKKYVLVNLPSMHLVATDGVESITMRIGLGTQKTKTPLLNSAIKRMDFNPQWVIPKSIVKTSIRQHAGSRGYFDSHNYFIQQRSTGKTVDPGAVTGDMLMSADYLVVQRGGVGNAMGRVVFRFDNNFSIFLHDTSNPGVFAQRGRSVSHGCIRVERPFDLAVFMLKDKDGQLVERMRYSMTVDYRPSHTSDPGEAPGDVRENIDTKRMVRSVNVYPHVPLFITYYTLYPDATGKMCYYDDIYGFDNLIYKGISQYLK